jgi:Holliday junction DNA helicase RuvA
MISRLTGTLLQLDGTRAEIELSGGAICYEVMLPAYIAQRLASRVGQSVQLHTMEYLESQNQGASYTPRLIGFASPRDREFFDLFTTVKGIGNKKALRAMAAEPAAIARAISSRDIKGLTQLPEIGKRMAETIVAELHGKVDGYLSESEVSALNAGAELKPTDAVSPDARDAIETLVALGTQRADAERNVALAVDRAAASGRRLASASEIVDAVFGAR